MIDRRDLLRGGAALGLTVALPRAARADGAPFRIGALNPITGAGKPFGPGMQAAIKLAAEAVNRAGGAAGRPLEVIAEDDQTAPAHAVLAAKKLIEVDHVQAIVGTWASSVTLAVMKLTDAASVIEMNTSSAPEISTLDTKDLVWRFQATTDQFGRAFAAAAKQRGFTRPATLAAGHVPDGFKAAWSATGGTVAASVIYEPYRSSYRAELQQVLAAKPDVIVLGAFLHEATAILREWRREPADLAWIIPGWAANPELVKACGPELTEGVISIDTVPNLDAASFQEFSAAYKTATGQDGASNIYAAMAYDMVIVLALAIEAAGPTAPLAAINAKLREVANPPGEKVYSFAAGKAALKAGKIDYDGASSRLDFDAAGDIAPSFGVSVITGGALQRREVITL
ncbi:MAG: ABC transporter substrate-binding protein [Alphaproteobacteria bacterium]|nr:ABC transporter substrate-binding protein [Alphaproteobacteria bacterium]